MRFLLDENIPKRLAMALRAEGHDVLRVQELGIQGAADEEVWSRARATASIFITADRDFPLPAPKPPAMVLLRRFDRVTISTFVEVVLDAIKSLDEEIDGLLVVITPGRVRRRRL
jgi:predicted nuclease of predicted toxin-antitoxin system